MSDCDNCIHCERRDDMITCMLGHLFVGIRKNCGDYEHWNSLSGDGV